MFYGRAVIRCDRPWQLLESLYVFSQAAVGINVQALCVLLSGLAAALLAKNSAISSKKFREDPVTFHSEPLLRSCTALQFPPPHCPPHLDEFIATLTVVDSRFVTLAYFPPADSKWKKVRTLRHIYYDADIVKSMEDNWTKDVKNFSPAKLILEHNSYIVFHQSRCKRAEVLSITKLDEDSMAPVRVAVVMVDTGQVIELPVVELFALPPVIPVVAPKLAFEAVCELNEMNAVKNRPAEKKVCGVPRTVALNRKVSPKVVTWSAELFTHAAPDEEGFIMDAEELLEMVGSVVYATCTGVRDGTPVLKIRRGAREPRVDWCS